MPISCKFTNRVTGESIPLKDLDDIICKITGKTPDPENMSIEYESLCMFGIGALMHSKACILTEKAFEKHWKRCMSKFPESKPFWHKFLIEDYTFEAWR